MANQVTEMNVLAKKLSLPHFAARRLKWLGSVTVGGQSRKYLSEGLPALTADERRQLASKISDIESDLHAGSEHDLKVKAALLGEMFLMFAGAGHTQTTLDLRSQIYLEVLAAIPAWAIRIALRKWYAGKVPDVAESEFRFAPSPAYLRRASEDELHPYQSMLDELRLLLDAKPLDETIRELEQTTSALRSVT